MIYRKKANFPYPVFSNDSLSYINNYFNLDVNVIEKSDSYYFDIDFEIESEFINQLIRNDQAQLVFIIQSKDNKFFHLKANQHRISIPKSRISLNKRTSIQLHIQALNTISFADNNELNNFYHVIKDEIVVPQYSLLGYSNVVLFDGSIKKPYDLFSKNLDENLNSEIKIELGQETIVIHYKKPEFYFQQYSKSNMLNNAYIYAGLTKALQSFIFNNGEDGDVELEEINEPDGSLDLKLYQLMINKNINNINLDNIDEVIYKVTDRVIEKYSGALEELLNRGDSTAS